MCVCGSGRVPHSPNVTFLGWFHLQELALTSERHTSTGSSTGAFTSAGGHRHNACEAKKAEQKKNAKNVHSSRGDMLHVSAGTKQCALIGLKRLKRRPADTATDLDGPERSQTKAENDLQPFYLAPISAPKTCDKCCSFCP